MIDFTQVGPETTFETTVCRCTHLTNFGSGFFVAPNPIDFDAVSEGFADISSNPVVFATVITIFGLYIIGVMWARWKDKKDLQKVIYFSKQNAIMASTRDSKSSINFFKKITQEFSLGTQFEENGVIYSLIVSSEDGKELFH